MENSNYLIPANSKKGLLIFNAFTPRDLIVFGTGLFITIIWVISFPPEELITTVLSLLPALLTGFLVTPIPNYHNVLVVLGEAVNYYSQRQNYVWKGWCFHEDSEKENK